MVCNTAPLAPAALASVPCSLRAAQPRAVADAELLAAAAALPPGFWETQRTYDLSRAANVVEALAMVYLAQHAPPAQR